MAMKSLTVDGKRWYYSNHVTTVDWASMACEDRGTRLMTLDEFLPMQRVILDNMPTTNRSIWLLNPVSTAPLAYNIDTNEQKNYSSTALIMCKFLKFLTKLIPEPPPTTLPTTVATTTPPTTTVAMTTPPTTTVATTTPPTTTIATTTPPTTTVATTTPPTTTGATTAAPTTTVATTAAPTTTVATTTAPVTTVATTAPATKVATTTAPATTVAMTTAPATTVAMTSPVTNLNFECRGFNIMISLNRTTITEANTLCTQQSGMKLLRSRWQLKLEDCYMPILNRENVEEIWMRQIRKRPKATAWMMYNVSSSQLNPTPDASATAAFICAGKYFILHDEGLSSLLC
ncbi:uncharacterized protein LOC135827130 [Sycon ciliatum]|uniref:uncharacterized protein LOC135827130 n=1 Tax=Sycon ciliatum TaxID=27933 RepID=UPI0031F715DE